MEVRVGLESAGVDDLVGVRAADDKRVAHDVPLAFGAVEVEELAEVVNQSGNLDPRRSAINVLNECQRANRERNKVMRPCEKDGEKEEAKKERPRDEETDGKGRAVDPPASIPACRHCGWLPQSEGDVRSDPRLSTLTVST